MRKNIGKRLLALLLTLVLTVGVLPPSAYAALRNNNPAYNKQILSALENVVGSEDEAKNFYSVLQQYNLLDEDGNLVEKWNIVMDGQRVTLDQLRNVLQGTYDPNKIVYVDNQQITLDDLNTMLQIEDYLSYLKETYFSGSVWTQEQLDSLDSLVNQINESGITINNPDAAPVGPSGVKHSARVSVTAGEVADQTASFAVSLTGAAEGQTVSFAWTAVSGSQPVTGTTTGTVTMTADANGTARDTITVPLAAVSADSASDPVRASSGLVFALELSSIHGALFENSAHAMTVQGKVSEGTVASEDMPVGTLQSKQTLKNSNTETAENWSESATYLGQFQTDISFAAQSGAAGNALRWKLPSEVTVSANGTLVVDTATASTDDADSFYYSNGGTEYYSSIEVYLDKDETKIAQRECGYVLDETASLSPSAFNKFNTDASKGTGTLTEEAYSDGKWTLHGAFCAYMLYKDGSSYVLKKRFPDVNVYLTLRDTRTPTVETVSAAAGTYSSGQSVPVTVRFSEPVNAQTAKATINGLELTAAEQTGFSNVLTFLYPVQQTDSTSLTVTALSAEDTSGNALDFGESSRTVADVVLETPEKSAAIAGMTAEVTEEDGSQKLNVSVTLSSDAQLTAWLATDMQSVSGGFAPKSLTVNVGGTSYPLIAKSETVTGQTLTASIDLDPNISGETVTHVVDLMLDGEVLVGWYAQAEQEAQKLVTADDVTATIAITDAAGSRYAFENAQTPVIYLQSGMPTIQASFALSGSDYAYGDTDSTAAAGSDDAETADFVWTSTNEDVARIDKNGLITPTGKSGATTITLTARNGGAAENAVTVTACYDVYVADGENAKDSGVDAGTLTFAAGLTPFVMIPGSETTVNDGNDLTVYWSSNLCDKNGTEETVFTVTAQRDGAETAWSATVTGTAENPGSCVTIPGGVLGYDYGNEKNDITVTVSADYEGVTYSDTVVVRVLASPAQVSLGKLDSYYILDTAGSVPISWQVSNLTKLTNQTAYDSFTFQISRDGKTIYTTHTPSLSNGSASGTYTLSGLAFEAASGDPTSYRQVYTVTLQARNDTDSTWSYDSFLLYVYDADTLQIMVDGATAGSTMTVSNRSEIASMSQEEILAMKRDIYLKHVVSANYGDYAWSEVADQIEWASSDNSAATLNYQVGSSYDNIENYTYVSYRPATEFGLSGVSDGTTTITATHKLTGMTDSLQVNVETLKNHLYLFQTYPQAVTKLTFRVYTDSNQKNTKTVSIYSDDTGAAAYYAEYGIAGDVFCQTVDESGNITTTDGSLYVGTLYAENLKSGEGDWVDLERYPLNSLQLRRAAYACLYLKDSQGEPYTGSITFRGGVYVNGTYLADAKFGLNSAAASQAGDQDTTVTLGADGKLEVVMDLTQWGLADNTLSASDSVSYVFEISQADDSCYPIFVTIDATVNEDDFVDSGDAVVNFRTNPETGKHPFVSSQTLAYTGYSDPVSVLEETGTLGPGAGMPEAVLNTTVMWWGEEKEENSKADVQLFLADSGLPVCSTDGAHTTSNSVYPFSDWMITEYTVKLNETTMTGLLESGTDSGVVLEYYRDGATLTRRETLPFRLGNYLGITAPESDPQVLAQLTNLSQNELGNGGKECSVEVGLGDQLLTIAMAFLSDDAYSRNTNKFLSVQITPTSSSTRFLGLMQFNPAGTMSETTQGLGVYRSKNNTGNAQSWAALTGKEFKLIGSCLDFKAYYNSYKEDMLKAKNKEDSALNFDYDVGGYMECEFIWNEVKMKWDINILSGGFNFGFGIFGKWKNNFMVGPFPMNLTFQAGGSAGITVKTLKVSYKEWEESEEILTANDWLTELRLYFYAGFFFGVGFDYTVIALKAGVYGQINADAQFLWLTRPYLGDGESVNITDGGKDDLLAEQYFEISGQVGAEVYIHFLFYHYEYIIGSIDFGDDWNTQSDGWDNLNDVWKQNQQAYEDAYLDTKENQSQAALASLVQSGAASVFNVGNQQMVMLTTAGSLEDRSYLESDSYNRRWGDSGVNLFSAANGPAVKNLESSTYPYADPILSDDGQIMVYITDQEDPDVTANHIAFSTCNGSSYTKGSLLPDGEAGTGYGDDQATVSGTEDFAVAAWTRMSQSVEKDAGSVLTEEDQMMLLNGEEVYASVYDGSSWTTTALSENFTADMAPAAAAANGKALVAWRSASSSDAANISEFDQKDTIVFKIWDGSQWSEKPVTLYNGTSGSVEGLSAAITPDGSTAAVTYAVDTDGDSTTSTDREIVYAVIDLGTGSVVRNVMATNDAYLDENPQITCVKIGGEDRFVLAWYSEQAVGTDAGTVLNGGSSENADYSDTVSDIRLIDFDTTGTPTLQLPDSLSGSGDTDISNNFRFAKNADTIENLSILWVERATDYSVSEDADPDADPGDLDISDLDIEMNRDVLKGVRFYPSGSSYTITGALDVAGMEENTLIDHFDAFVSDPDTNTVSAVVMATTYGGEEETTTKVVTLTDGTQMQMQVPTQTSALYTATASYQDTLEVSGAVADYENIRRGNTTQISFDVKNNGIHAIDSLKFDIGGTVTNLTDLNLLPGESVQVYADYDVPENRVDNPDYTVTASFDAQVGAAGSASQESTVTGKIFLGLPDLSVTKAKIVKEEDGERTIQVSLNNTMDARLAGSDYTVRLGFYTDSTCENQVPGMEPILISDSADLAMIDEGGYSTQATFRISDYLDSINAGKAESEKLTELNESGLTVYVKAEIVKSNGYAQTEIYSDNNTASVVVENLAVRTGEDALINSTLSNDGGTSVVTVTVQNTHLSQTTTGNLTVSLLDSEGNVLETQQSYNGEGLLTLGGEEKVTRTYSFAQSGASVQVSYTDLVLDADNAELDSLSFTNIPGITLDSFVYNEATGRYEAAASTTGLTGTAVAAQTKSGLAKATASSNGSAASAGSNALRTNVDLTTGQNTITVQVTSQDGTAVRTYVLTVQNSQGSGEPTDTGVTLNLTGKSAVTADNRELSYVLSAENADRLATMTLTFRVDGLTAPVVKGMNGWETVAQTCEDGVLTAVLYNKDGVSGQTDLLELTGTTGGKPGTVSVKLTDAVLSAYVGESEDFVKAVYGQTTVTTQISWSVFDVNQDGVVDLLDITRAQRSFQKKQGAEGWNALADVDGSGEVDISDLILILNNYTQKA